MLFKNNSSAGKLFFLGGGGGFPRRCTMECRDFLTTLGFVSKIPFASHLSTEFVKVPS